MRVLKKLPLLLCYNTGIFKMVQGVEVIKLQETLVVVQIITSLFCIISPIVAVITLTKNIQKTSVEDTAKKIQEAKEEGARDANILFAINTLTEKVDKLVDNQVTKEEFSMLEGRVKLIEQTRV